MVVQEKKQKREIRIYVDLGKLNDACVNDPFPTPFTDKVLENVGGQEAYSFTDGFSGYHQIKIVPEDRSKTTFANEWGCFQYIVIPFGLKNALAIFLRIVVAAFKEFIHKFLEIALNLKKCTFLVPFGNLLGHVVCKQGLMVDLAKIAVILNLQVPRSVKQLGATLGHTGYYRKFTKSYTQITAPMEQLSKKDATYCWNEECNKSLETLKENMASAPILVFPKWDIEFHMHVDASCIALGVVLT
eukprot:PITA_23346